MDRRFLLKMAAAAPLLGAPVLSRPALAQGTAARTLRFVPQSNLANFDPIWGTQLVVRNASAMVWETLYGVDEKIEPQRQMVESESVSDDGLTWSFTLRSGLKWHDGAPVLAKDCVASLKRWQVRDPMGQMLRAIQQELVAVDDRSFRWVLKSPFPHMKLALGKTNTPMAFMMPERIAQTDPFQQIKEYIGSGPYRFLPQEWVPGAKAVFERFADYVPREEPASWLAGGRRALVERVEWVVMPDAATAAGAMQSGEIDWWENPIVDLLPILRSARGIQVGIADPLGNLGVLRMNHLQKPFNDPKARQAVLLGIDQRDCVTALVGEDPANWSQVAGYFTPGTPNYTEAGGDILKGPRDLAKAQAMLKSSNYNGEKVVMLVAQDQPITKAFGDVTSEQLKAVGFNVEYVATDWGTVGTRRTSKVPVDEGGWSIFFSWFGGADCTNPAGYNGLRANGDGAWFGWPTLPEVEAARDAWFAATDPAAGRAAMDRMNAAAVAGGLYAPTGFFKTFQSWRGNISGVVAAPMPLFWDVAKA